MWCVATLVLFLFAYLVEMKGTIPVRWAAWNSISSCDFEVLELYSRPEYLGSDGVVDAETCDEIVNGIVKDSKGLV